MDNQLEQLEVTYLNAKLYVEPKDQKEFIRLSPLYAKIIHENYGYQLVHASYPTTGEVNLFTHIWKIPKGVALGDVMKATGDQVLRETKRERILEAAATTTRRVREQWEGSAPVALIDESTLLALEPGAEGDVAAATPSPVQDETIHELTEAAGKLLSRLEKGSSTASKLEAICEKLEEHCSLCQGRETRLANYGTFHTLDQIPQVNSPEERNTKSVESSADLLAQLAGMLAKAALDVWLSRANLGVKNLDAAAALARDCVVLAERVIETARQNYQISGVSSPFLKIQSLIQRTEQNLMAALPYDPQLFGHQNQTIFVDADGALWLMEHDVLKSMKEAEVAADTPTELKLRRLLEQGATVATLKGGEAGDSLLFNLAGIQPKSVFQYRAAPAGDSLDVFKMLPKVNNTALPGEVHLIYVATPWGTIYKLDSAAIKKASVSLKVASEATLENTRNPEERAKVGTKHLMGALLEARVPLAAIPEVRDQDIGWGYYCYVINLQSFVRQDEDEASSANG